MKAPEPYLVWREPEGAGAPSGPETMGGAAINRWLRYSGLIALLLIVLPPIPFLMQPLWLLAVATGYAAAAVIAVLMLLPLRRLQLWPRARISVPRHQRLGEIALALTALHLALFVAADTLTIEYLLPSQPRYMAAGNIGLIVLVILVVTSLERVRVQAFGPRFRFRTVHVVASIILVVLVAGHMIGSAIYVSGPVKAALCAFVGVLLVAATLKQPEPSGEEQVSQAGETKGHG